MVISMLCRVFVKVQVTVAPSATVVGSITTEPFVRPGE